MISFKKIAFLIALTASGLSLIRLFSQQHQYKALNESLPDFLFDVTGTRPKVTSQFGVNKLTLEIGFPESVSNKHPELAEMITRYVSDYYDKLSNTKLDIKIYSTNY